MSRTLLLLSLVGALCGASCASSVPVPVPPVPCTLPGYPELPDIAVGEVTEGPLEGLIVMPPESLAVLAAWAEAVDAYRRDVERCPHVRPSPTLKPAPRLPPNTAPEGTPQPIPAGEGPV